MQHEMQHEKGYNPDSYFKHALRLML